MDPVIAFLDSTKDFDTVTLARTTQKAMELIMSWCQIEHSSTAVTVAQEINLQVQVYAQAIDSSLEAANMGFMIAEDAIFLVESIKETTPAERQEFLEGIKVYTAKGYAKALEARKGFVEVRTTVYNLLKKMKVENEEEVKVEYTEISTNGLLDKNRRPFTEVKSELAKGINDLEEFGEMLSKFASWWNEMAYETASQLQRKQQVTDKMDKMDTLRLRAIEQKWRNHKIRYAAYVNEIDIVQDRYPKFLRVKAPAPPNRATTSRSHDNWVNPGSSAPARDDSRSHPYSVVPSHETPTSSYISASLAAVPPISHRPHTDAQKADTPSTDQKRAEDELGRESPDEVEQHSLGTTSCEDLSDPTLLSNDDVIILIVGSTGSGKSNFIDTLVGQRGRRAGSSMKSCTSKVGATRILDHPVYGNRIVLVDTPGFNDTSKPDIDILEIMAEWLVVIDKKCLSIRGILYLHRISDVRFSGSHVLNFKAFSAMCGENIASNIAIITTMWDEFSSDVGTKTEKDLTSNYWNVLLKHGATSQRFDNTYISAQSIVEKILRSHGPVRMQLQREMVDMNKDLWDTSAGQILSPGVSPRNGSNAKLKDEASDKGTANSTRSGNGYTIRDASQPPLLDQGSKLSDSGSKKRRTSGENQR